MKNIAIAGNLIVDFVKKIDSSPARGQLSTILDISRGVGGCACNTSTALAALDPSLTVTAMGRIGNDESGRYIESFLNDHGVRTNIVTDPTLPTSFTDVMSEERGERTFFHARGANAAFAPGDIPENLDCDLFHAGYILLLDSMDAKDEEYGTALARTLASVRSQGIKTSADVVSENSDRFAELVIPSLKHCDYFIVNETEASKTTGLVAREPDGLLPDKNVKPLLERLLDLGVHEIAVIHAPEGGWALSRTEGYAFSPSLDLPPSAIKGHVGAGDAFCAGMLYGICRGFELKRALATAVGAAACNLMEANSTDGLRGYEDVIKMIGKWGFKGI